MKFDAKKHDILVVKTEFQLGASDTRELFLLKSGDDLVPLLAAIPEQYHVALRNSKEAVASLMVHIPGPGMQITVLTSLVVRMPRHRSWHQLVPHGTTFAKEVLAGRAIVQSCPVDPRDFPLAEDGSSDADADVEGGSVYVD